MGKSKHKIIRELTSYPTDNTGSRYLRNKQMSHGLFRSTPEWKDLRAQVLERDAYKCTCCGIKYQNNKLQCHHKDTNPANYYNIDNIDDFMTLCNNCHSLIHSFENKCRNKKRAFVGDPNLITFIIRYFK